MLIEYDMPKFPRSSGDQATDSERDRDPSSEWIMSAIEIFNVECSLIDVVLFEDYSGK